MQNSLKKDGGIEKSSLQLLDIEFSVNKNNSLLRRIEFDLNLEKKKIQVLEAKFQEQKGTSKKLLVFGGLAVISGCILSKYLNLPFETVHITRQGLNNSIVITEDTRSFCNFVYHVSKTVIKTTYNSKNND